MGVYAICELCKRRRERCSQPTTHKRRIGWTADWQPSRNEKRIQKTFGSDVANPKELADIQFRQWKTDRERGVLNLKSGLVAPTISFEQVADEWWTKVALGQARIKDPKRSEKSRYETIKRVFGSKLLSDTVPEDEAQRMRYMTLDVVEEWVTERMEAGLAVNTINRDLKPLRWMLEYAVSKKYLKANPIDGLAGLKGGNIRVRWLTKEEIPMLVKAALDLGDADLVDVIAVGLNTGFRKGNLERLSARDVEEHLVTAQKTKSGNPYDVPLSPDIAPLLRRLAQQKPTGPLLNTAKLDARFRAVARLAGLYPAEGVQDGKKDQTKVTIHTLRHTFAAQYLKRCANPRPGDIPGDIYKLSKLMGHASSAITEKVYGHLCPKDMAAQAPLISIAIEGIEQPRLKVI